ncbi:MAG: response regulator transcription factor [Candidatus Acidiferrum sp.]
MQGMNATNESSAITLLIAESCQMNCELMAAALERSPYPLSVIAAATDSEEVLKHYSSKTPDVCIIGSRLKDGARSGLSVTRELCLLHPSARVILLLDSEQPELVIEAFRAGAKGIFSREEPFEALCKSAHKVHEGHIWASNRHVHYLVESLADSRSAPSPEPKTMPLLTKREQSLVQLVAEGRTNRDISRELKLSEHTVRNYLFRIFNKLGTSNRLELALYALNHQLTNRDDPVE